MNRYLLIIILAILNGNIFAQDIGVIAVYNKGGFEDQGEWMLFTDSSYSYFVDVLNNGNDLEAGDYIINFTIVDPDGNELFDYDMPGLAIGDGDTISVECDSSWTIPEDAELGNYEVWVTAILVDDDELDNNVVGLDQLVHDVWVNEGDRVADEWFGYISGNEDELIPHNQICECNENLGVVFYHPGGEDNLKMDMTHFRVAVHSDDEARNVNIRVGVINRVLNQYRWIWTFESETSQEEGWEWLEFEVPEPDFRHPYYPPNSDEAMIIMLDHDENVSIMVDNNQPIAGLVHNMPDAMWSLSDDGLMAANEGDFAIQAKFECYLNPGARWTWIEIIPDNVDFGMDLEQGDDYSIDLQFVCHGTDSVTVRNALVPHDVRQYLSVELEGGNIFERFSLAPEDTIVVTVTYHAPQYHHELETYIQFVTNAVEDPRRAIPVRAATTMSIEGNGQSELPQRFKLLQNYPNPFNSKTTIEYHLPTVAQLELGLYDIAGREVVKMFSGVRDAGVWSATIDASELSTGVYFVKMVTENQQMFRKVLLVK